MKNNRINPKGLNINASNSSGKGSENKKLSPYHYVYVSKQWRYAREKVLNENPICEDCEAKGRVTEATSVNHIVPLRRIIEAGKPIATLTKKEKQLVFGYENLEALCHRCHGKKEMEMVKHEKAESKMELERIENEKRHEQQQRLKEKNDRGHRRDRFKHKIYTDENGKGVYLEIF